MNVKSPEENKLNEALIKEMTEAITKGEYPNIHSVLIALKGNLLYEQYFNGNDEVYGHNIGMIESSKDYLHDLRSISKLIVSACVGLAIDQGIIKNVGQLVSDFFPAHPSLQSGMKTSLTIEHLLTMTSGLVWNEPVPFNDPDNSEVLMINNPNPIDFVLNSEIDIEPGKEWRYNGGNTQLLAAIIEMTSNLPIDKFAEKYLFAALSIKDFEWIRCPKSNNPAAASGLRLTSRDLLKLGLLYLNQGKWEGKQLIPQTWAIDSLESHIQRSETESYGYGFWLWTDTISNKTLQFAAAPGNGDQRIYIEKSNDLVLIVTAGNYDDWNIPNNSYALLKDFIFPSLIA